jgi:hypothetical protein
MKLQEELNKIKATMIMLGENVTSNELDEINVDQNMYPKFNLDVFKDLKTFNKRIQYCNATLKRLGSGSSRTVYQIDLGSVLKLAKNKYGLQQNRLESDAYSDNHFSEIRTNVLDYDKTNYEWIVSEIATKITPFMFKEYTGFALKKVDGYLNLKYAENEGSKITDDDYYRYMTPTEKEIMDNSDFIMKIVEFMHNNGLAAGDLGRISSWGVVKRDHDERVVLIDYGFTGKYD